MRITLPILMFIAFSPLANAACLHKFIHRDEGSRQSLTLLTGALTYVEAKTLSAKIDSKDAAPVEWVDAKGKTLARQSGKLAIVRPMPVACDGRTSGVVISLSLTGFASPSKEMNLKIAGQTIRFVQVD